jgi:hypothetical protein
MCVRARVVSSRDVMCFVSKLFLHLLVYIY